MINRWNLGDDQAFVFFYKRHVRCLVQIAFIKTGNIVIAENLVQDAFATFYEQRGVAFLNPTGYIVNILKNKIMTCYLQEFNRKVFSNLDKII